CSGRETLLRRSRDNDTASSRVSRHQQSFFDSQAIPRDTLRRRALMRIDTVLIRQELHDAGYLHRVGQPLACSCAGFSTLAFARGLQEARSRLRSVA
ncbi:hypothetical protein ACJRO7_010743, partial [Eucalyptus globulus]